MTEHISPSDTLPSTRTLIRSTVIAVVVAAALLVTIVLPAEYGVDPTGVGGLLGLTAMGEIKESLHEEADKAQNAAPPPCPPPASTTASPTTATPAPVASSSAAGSAAAVMTAERSDVTQVTLAPDEGKEVKMTIREGVRVTFSWSTDKGVVNYDLHSDHPTKGTYHGYGKGVGVRTHEGVLVAAFDGKHGWFWRNRTREVVTITLKTNGEYQELKELE